MNGSGLRLAQLAAGALPGDVPVLCKPLSQDTASAHTVRFEAAQPCAAPLPHLDSGALSPIKYVLLHGSMATDDACGFSDVDVAVFVDDVHEYPAEAHRAAVLELRRLLHAILAFDPLMHHGLMFAPASALDRYDQRFLPIETLAQARVLHGPAIMQLQLVQPPQAEFAAALRGSASSILRHVQTGAFMRDDYTLKNFLSGALLLPSRILAARATFVYKRDSFTLARTLFDAAEWEFIARCEALRAFWKRPPSPLPERALPSRVHPHLHRVIGRGMAPRLNARRLSRAMLEGLHASARHFLASVEIAA